MAGPHSTRFVYTVGLLPNISSTSGPCVTVPATSVDIWQWSFFSDWWILPSDSNKWLTKKSFFRCIKDNVQLYQKGKSGIIHFIFFDILHFLNNVKQNFVNALHIVFSHNKISFIKFYWQWNLQPFIVNALVIDAVINDRRESGTSIYHHLPSSTAPLIHRLSFENSLRNHFFNSNCSYSESIKWETNARQLLYERQLLNCSNTVI